MCVWHQKCEWTFRPSNRSVSGVTEASGGAGARATAEGEGAGVWKPSEGSRERDRAIEADKSERDGFTWGPAAVYCAQSVVIVGPLKEAVSLQKSRDLNGVDYILVRDGSTKRW